ncbi:MAG TPA: ribosome biogenesis GTPase Der [bacterium]|nr:ribosome biogenesis GTPase Der [bacterium]
MASVGLPAVAIVGRPNVGKSALFNRLLARRHAIVSDIPGVTRDRLEAPCQWAGREFLLVDTGGLVSGDPEPLAVQVRRQAEHAIAASQAILFVVDVSAGMTPQDAEIASVLRRSHHPVLVAVNKVDTPALAPAVHEFHALGLGEPMAISATHGLGIGDLLDAVVAVIPKTGEDRETEDAVRIAFLGRPNVGKSSLVNALLGEERVIVDARPGTTRDAIDTLVHYDGRPMVLIDTAGLRRRSRVEEPIEFYSTRRTHEALARADVAVLVIDAVEGITDQDQKIARAVYDAGRAVVIAVNKWDLLPGYSPQQIHEVAQSRLRFLGPLLMCLTVAIRQKGIDELMTAVLRAAQSHAARIPTGPLNRAIEEATRATDPPADPRGRRLHIYYATQPQTKPPTIVLFVNDPTLCPPEYRRYLERRLRDAFDLVGTPIRWTLRRRRPAETTRKVR